MPDTELILEILHQIEDATKKVVQRFPNFLQRLLPSRLPIKNYFSNKYKQLVRIFLPLQPAEIITYFWTISCLEVQKA